MKKKQLLLKIYKRRVVISAIIAGAHAQRIYRPVAFVRKLTHSAFVRKMKHSKYIWLHMLVSPINSTRSRGYCRTQHVVFRAFAKLHAGSVRCSSIFACHLVITLAQMSNSHVKLSK